MVEVGKEVVVMAAVPVVREVVVMVDAATVDAATVEVAMVEVGKAATSSCKKLRGNTCAWLMKQTRRSIWLHVGDAGDHGDGNVHTQAKVSCYLTALAHSSVLRPHFQHGHARSGAGASSACKPGRADGQAGSIHC